MEETKKSPARPELAQQIDRILAILHKWGIHTLGDFAQLEKEELRARLGPEAAVLWERATGNSNRLLKLVQPPESFQESFEFEHEIETIEPLLFMLRRFLQQLARRLKDVYLVAQELTITLTFRNGREYVRTFKIPQPTADIDLLFRMLHTHLESFKSDEPIIAVSLELKPLKPGQQQFGLFETTLRNPNQLCETLGRLTALFGCDRVGTPVLQDTHCPDAFQMEPFSWQCPEPGGVIDSSPGIALRRLRLATPLSAGVDVQQAIAPPGAQTKDPITAQRGPYIGSGNWWDEKSWSRTEWDVELKAGPLLRCHESAGAWQIDGIYD